MRFKALRVCQSNGFSIVPQEVARYDLTKAEATLRGKGYEVVPREVMVITSKDGVEVTLYVNGRLMVQPVESKELAVRIAEEFYAAIEDAKEEVSGQ